MNVLRSVVILTYAFLAWLAMYLPAGRPVRKIANRHGEKRLEAGEDQFRTLVQNMPGAVFRCLIDEHRTMRFISDEIEALTGFAAADFIDNQVRSFAGVIHPEDQARVRAEVSALLAERGSYQVEYRLAGDVGRGRWVTEYGRRISGN